MSTRSNPFEEIERFFQRIGRQDDPAHIRRSDGVLGRWNEGGPEMAVDLVERGEEFVVTADLPGFEKSDVDVRVTDHTLHIEADHEGTVDEADAQYLRHERRHQSMRRSIRLPEDVEKDGVQARMRNGVLTVTVPKLEEPRTVDIE